MLGKRLKSGARRFWKHPRGKKFFREKKNGCQGPGRNGDWGRQRETESKKIKEDFVVDGKVGSVDKVDAEPT